MEINWKIDQSSLRVSIGEPFGKYDALQASRTDFPTVHFLDKVQPYIVYILL